MEKVRFGLAAIILAFVVLKVVFFNLTPAQWGDSYRFLRAGVYLSRLSYPLDEKRLPLFPAFLAPSFVLNIDPIVWGHVVVLIFSVLSLVLVSKLAEQIGLRNPTGPILAVAITAFSPVFFYWTSQIYAETLFAFLVLLAFYVYYGKDVRFKSILLGVITGFAFMTRFEGLLLFVALFLSSVHKFHRSYKTYLGFIAGFALVSAPYFVFRYLSIGSLSSVYLSEPSTFSFSLNVILTFLASLIFVFGFIPFISFPAFREVRGFVKRNVPLALFIILELLLALFWQTAVPRLFVPIIPLLALLFVKMLSFEKVQRPRTLEIAIFCFLFLVFLVGRIYLRLPFLVSGKFVLVPIILSVLYVLFLYLKHPAMYALVLSAIISSFLVSYAFKGVYKSIFEASKYAISLNGKVVYSDETGVSRWYLSNKGVYYNLDLSNDGEYTWLRENNVSYIVDTNEHNEGSKLEVFKDPGFKDKFLLMEKFKVGDMTSSVYKVL